MTCNNKFVDLMHNYLDGDLTKSDEQQLKDHLQSCKRCQNHFQELKRTVTLLKSNDIQVSNGFTQKVMNNLPKENKRVSYMRWFKAHPVVTAAAIFFIFMFSGLLSAWEQDSQLTVSKDKNLVIQEDTVIVPEGVTVDGDLIIKNGDLKIDGEVTGDVVIINGEHLLASAGNVTGELEQVNQLFDWLWYHVKNVVKSVFTFTND